jgi:hypothetical protein
MNYQNLDIDILAKECWLMKKVIKSTVDLSEIYKIKTSELRRMMIRKDLTTYQPKGESFEIRLYPDGVGLVYSSGPKKEIKYEIIN